MCSGILECRFLKCKHSVLFGIQNPKGFECLYCVTHSKSSRVFFFFLVLKEKKQLPDFY